MDFESLAGLRRYLEIRHHVPGRIRVVFRPDILKDPGARKLMNGGGSLPPGVLDVRLNALARSVVMEYDRNLIPPDLLEDLLRAHDDDQAAQLLRRLNEILNAKDT